MNTLSNNLKIHIDRLTILHGLTVLLVIVTHIILRSELIIYCAIVLSLNLFFPEGVVLLYQAIILEFFKRVSIEEYFLFFCIVSVLSGIYFPVLVSKLVIKINWKPLLKVCGL